MSADLVTPELALARHHADAISDTGDGYTVRALCRGWWRIDCLWCEWNERGTTKARAVERYRAHEDAMLAPLRPPRPQEAAANA